MKLSVQIQIFSSRVKYIILKYNNLDIPQHDIFNLLLLLLLLYPIFIISYSYFIKSNGNEITYNTFKESKVQSKKKQTGLNVGKH